MGNMQNCDNDVACRCAISEVRCYQRKKDTAIAELMTVSYYLEVACRICLNEMYAVLATNFDLFFGPDACLHFADVRFLQKEHT